MAWIKILDEQQADGQLHKVYDDIRKARGKVANILKVQSLRPRAMEGHIALYESIMFEASNISRQEREMIAVAVSSANHCKYCVSHHSEALRYYWNDPIMVQNLIERGQDMDLPIREKTMLHYAIKLTRKPDEIEEKDVEALRDQGLTDVDILDLAQVVAYFNFVNRMALGLGVEFSLEEMRGYNY
jgi:uncharacterized peroxidase-related enzyme